jgi:hypothetical protein
VGKCSDERRAAAAAGWCGLPFPDLDDVDFFVADL